MFSKSIKCITASAMLTLSAPAFADGIPAYVVPSDDGTTFSVDLDALQAEETMTDVEKGYVLSGLYQSPNIQTTELVGIGGIDVTCDTHWTSAECKLTISKSTTATLAGLSPIPLAAAICAPITAESGEVLQLICAPALAFIANSTIKPALKKCVDQSKGVKMEINFSIVHPKDSGASASCH